MEKNSRMSRLEIMLVETRSKSVTMRPALNPYVSTVALSSCLLHPSNTLSVKHALIFQLSRSNWPYFTLYLLILVTVLAFVKNFIMCVQVLYITYTAYMTMNFRLSTWHQRFPVMMDIYGTITMYYYEFSIYKFQNFKIQTGKFYFSFNFYCFTHV